MAGRRLVDGILPRFDVVERHVTTITASPEIAYRCVRGLDAGRLPLTAVLMALRGVPHVLTGQIRPSRHLTFDDLMALGFVILADDPPWEIVLGAVGRFWLPTGGIVRISPAEFAEFSQPGHARAAWNFSIDKARGGCVLSTETRVDCLDDAARWRFRGYWAVVGPFSRLIRREMLRLIRRDAERMAGVR